MFPGLLCYRAHRLEFASRLIGIMLALYVLGLGGCRFRMAEANTGGAGSGPARLVVPETPLELGQAVPGEELAGSLALKNAGGEPLHIERLEAGCGCASWTCPNVPSPRARW